MAGVKAGFGEPRPPAAKSVVVGASDPKEEKRRDCRQTGRPIGRASLPDILGERALPVCRDRCRKIGLTSISSSGSTCPDQLRGCVRFGNRTKPL